MLSSRPFSIVTGTLLAGALTAGSATAGLMVSQTNDASVLANSIAGSGITLTGIQTYTMGAPLAFGTFSNGYDAGLGADAGVLVSTGAASDAEGPNFNPNTTTNHGTPGSPVLDPIAGGAATYDAASLTLQFESLFDGDLNFAFNVGTEEPNRGIGDVFSFFLDGNAAYMGAANGNATYSGYSLESATYGGGVAITPGDPNIEFNWVSDAINVTVTNVTKGIHSFTVAIADYLDGDLDSALFVGPVSLEGDPQPVPIPSTMALVILGSGLAMYRRLRIRRKDQD